VWLTYLAERNRRLYADRTAIIEAGAKLTYGELDERSSRLASGLLRLGVRPGDRVALASRNRSEVVETYFALSKLGAVAVPVNHALAADEARFILDSTQAAALLGEDALVARLGEACPGIKLSFDSSEYRSMAATEAPQALPEVAIDDLFAIFYTSATTGRPKGVMVDHRALKETFLSWAVDVRPPEGAIVLECCPLSHGTMAQVLAYMGFGAAVVLLRDFTPQACLEAIETERASHLLVVASMLGFLLRARALRTVDFSSLQEIVYGASPMSPGLLHEALAAFGCRFRNVYGTTEAFRPITTFGPEDHERGWAEGPIPAGRALFGMQIRIGDDLHRAPPAGGTGEVWVRGEGMMRGYWRQEEATAAAVRSGWLRTGDLGRIDEDGCLHLLGRSSDVIVRGGQNVYPAEIERVLGGHPAVVEVAVVGVADAEWGEVPIAFVVAVGEPGPAIHEELIRYCLGRLATYKRPARVELVKELPRGPAGKVLTRVLREAGASHTAPGLDR
jgi:acyl-CoA synthetase (AMP-forming)/AMP-acid ligase II